MSVLPDRLSLTLQAGSLDGLRCRGFSPDWSSLDLRSPAGRSSRQPLLKAVRGKKAPVSSRLVLDATAGWGEDAWLLAVWGYRVIAVEQNRIVFALLRDAWARMGKQRLAVASRMQPVCGDALELMRHWMERGAVKGREAVHPLSPLPDIVCLDPMFPGRERRKAKEKLPLQILGCLVAADPDRDQEMLDAALELAKHRVVVKRPRTACALLSRGQAPVHRIEGKGFRFDIYIPSQLCLRQT